MVSDASRRSAQGVSRRGHKVRALLHHRRLRVETLEDRTLLSIDLLSGISDPLVVGDAGNGRCGGEGTFFKPGTTPFAISNDGRYVAFSSFATNLTSGDTNGYEDIFVRDRQTGVTTQVSTDSSGNPGNNYSEHPAVSGDGRYVAFFSYASNLVDGDTNSTFDVFVKDLQTGATTRVNTDGAGNQTTVSYNPSISTDGRYVAFFSYAPTLVSGDTNGKPDIFVKDLQTGAVVRASTDSAGNQADNTSDYPAISGDGRYVAFQSSATNLVSGDTNAYADVFVKDLQTGVTTRVSTDSDGNQANAASEYYFAISGDGRYVVFQSSATNLVSGDTNGYSDVFVKDLQTGATTRASTNSAGNQANYWSEHPAISRDGLYVTFESIATNLVSGKSASNRDIFVKDLQTGATTRVSTNSQGTENWDTSDYPAISGGGRYVTFWSSASNLVSHDLNASDDIFVKDRQTGATSLVSARDPAVPGPFAAYGESRSASISDDGRYVVFNSQANLDGVSKPHAGDGLFLADLQADLTTRISVNTAGDPVNNVCQYPVISGNGRFVVFWTYASDVVDYDTNGCADIFLRDLQYGFNVRVSSEHVYSQSNGNADYYSSLSDDGRYVAFSSFATNLVSGDTNACQDVFLKDRTSDTMTRISTDSGGSQANNTSGRPSLSADGRYVVFESSASNLVNGDTNGYQDIFLKDLQTGAVARVSTDSQDNPANGKSQYAAFSGDGRYVAFLSSATNLVPDDTNGYEDVFVKDLHTGAIVRANTDSAGNQANKSTYAEPPTISDDGRYVAFMSNATNFGSVVTGVFVKDLQTGATKLANTNDFGVPGRGGAGYPAISGDGRYVAFESLSSYLLGSDGNEKTDVFRATTPQAFSSSLDVDGNGRADALTDGILVLRYLFDPSGQWNYSDALGSGATRTTRTAIKSYLDDGRPTILDVDGNGAPDALTDGILILRYLFDPAGQWNYSDALGSGATHTTRAALKAYMDQSNPVLAPAAGLVADDALTSEPTADAVPPVLAAAPILSATDDRLTSSQRPKLDALDMAIQSWGQSPADDTRPAWLRNAAWVAQGKSPAFDTENDLWDDPDSDLFSIIRRWRR